MRRVSRFQVAGAVTALFVGGTVAAGIALRPEASTDTGAAAAPEVIHKRKVKTISVPAGPPAVANPGVATASPSAATPVSVISRTSPAGGGSAGGYERDDDGSEIERGESD